MSPQKIMYINGIEHSLEGRHISHLAKTILDLACSEDGKGIVLILTEEEELTFKEENSNVGYYLFNLISDAVIAKSFDPKGLNYQYSSLIFVTG